MLPHELTKALSDLTRLRIVVLLTEQKELCVCDLMEVLELDQPKISRHLAVLREHQVLVDRRSAKWVFYRLNEQMSDWALQIVRELSAGSSVCEPYMSDREKLTKSNCFGAYATC